MKALSGFLILVTFFSTTSIFSQNFWEQTNGPYGGNVLSVAVDKNNTIFIGTLGKGIFRYSYNDGMWIETNNGITEENINVICASDNYIFAGNSKLFRSSNEGTSWEVIKEDSALFIYKMFIDGDNNLIIGTASGVFKSTDYGENWQTICTKNDLSAWGMGMNSKGDIFLSGFGGAYKYSLSDSSWTRVFLPSAVWDFIADSNDNIIAASDAAIYRSTDNGESWSAVTDLKFGRIFLSLRKNESGDIFAAGLNCMFKSTDNGLSWQEINGRISYQIINDLCFDSSKNILAATGGGGIFKSSNNGQYWIEFNEGLNNASISNIVVNAKKHLFAFTGYNGLFRSIDNGNSWETINNGIDPQFNSIVCFFVSREDNLFASFADALFFSPNEGETWTRLSIGSANLGASAIISNNEGYLFAATSDRVYKSTDNGNTWIKKGKGLSIPNNQVLTLSINSSGQIFAGARNGIFVSDDDGENWHKLMNGTSYPVFKLLINKKGYIFANTGDKGIFKSTDNGESWIEIGNGLPNSYVGCFEIDSSGNLFAGFYYEGIYYSTDNGDNWTPYNSGLSNFPVSCFDFTSDGYAFAGTGGDGIYRIKMQTTDIDDDKSNLSFSLSQNYPNPFNPSTVISYTIGTGQLSAYSHVSLKVYDILGNEVATLVNEEKQVGEYKVNFNASSFSSGIYFYVLNTGGNRLSRKMCLLK